MVRPKESRKQARAGSAAVGVVVGHRVVIIRDGKFVRPPRRMMSLTRRPEGGR
jgi:hypothetical protein